MVGKIGKHKFNCIFSESYCILLHLRNKKTIITFLLTIILTLCSPSVVTQNVTSLLFQQIPRWGVLGLLHHCIRPYLTALRRLHPALQRSLSLDLTINTLATVKRIRKGAMMNSYADFPCAPPLQILQQTSSSELRPQPSFLLYSTCNHPSTTVGFVLIVSRHITSRHCIVQRAADFDVGGCVHWDAVPMMTRLLAGREALGPLCKAPNLRCFRDMLILLSHKDQSILKWVNVKLYGIALVREDNWYFLSSIFIDIVNYFRE